jgi:hypothetical protein
MPTDTRGVFSLIEVVDVALSDEWVNLNDVWISLPIVETSNTGYFGGGGFPLVSTMNKVTYSSDTTAAVPGANLSVARYSLAATGNSTAGYFGGGSPGPFSTMDKLTYSTDTTAAAPSGANLSASRNNLAASSARANALPSSIFVPNIV